MTTYYRVVQNTENLLFDVRDSAGETVWAEETREAAQWNASVLNATQDLI